MRIFYFYSVLLWFCSGFVRCLFGIKQCL